MVLEKWSLILHSDNLKEAEAFSLKQRLSGCMSKTLAKGQLLSPDRDNCWYLFYWTLRIYCVSECLLN